MRHRLIAYRNNNKRYWNGWRKDCNNLAYVVYIIDGKHILSWALIYYGLDKPYAQIYTRRRYRRQGLGRKVFNKVLGISFKKFGAYPNVFRHDDTSTEFFDNVYKRG